MRDLQNKTSENFFMTLSETLVKEQLCEVFPENPEKYVINQSGVKLNQTEIEALSLGFKFHVPRKFANKIDTEAQLKNLLNQLTDLHPISEDKKGWFKSRLVDISNQYLCSPIQEPRIMTKEHRKVIKRLLNNEDIVILRPDKGSAVVVMMNKAEYVKKMESILNDTSKFKIDNCKDMTDSVGKKVMKVLRELLKKKMIENHTYNELKPMGSRLPYMYGLPKIHKNNYPMRPILSMVNSPFYKVARWLADRLESIRQRLAKHTLKDSFQFVEEVNQLNVHDKIMVSFYVTSLFTQIPLRETIDIICQHSDLLPLPKLQFKQLLML
ncbi:unnamed protein product [Trichobilharzia regenti]|nr:unnamed protein product [Trichobilharzia regenti]